MPLTKNILVRGIPATLHKRMKIEAARQERTLANTVIAALEFYLKNGRKRQNPPTP